MARRTVPACYTIFVYLWCPRTSGYAVIVAVTTWCALRSTSPSSRSLELAAAAKTLGLYLHGISNKVPIRYTVPYICRILCFSTLLPCIFSQETVFIFLLPCINTPLSFLGTSVITVGRSVRRTFHTEIRNARLSFRFCF
jgi:hypothetical protein